MAKGSRNPDREGWEVREMRSAETLLAIIRDRGRRGLPLEDVYRQRYNPDLYHRAYGKIYRNPGAMTPGVTGETVDGMTQGTIAGIIAALRAERYRWSPVRRVYIEKKHSTKKRPLGLPTWTDKLLQEVIRAILEAYYEPQFADHSHGFRPGRGCHTALQEIQHAWKGTVWFIEGDIEGCFDNIDHAVLLSIIAERIHDHRFIRLLDGLLRAGYCEDWRYNQTRSGTPQGGIVSPILANIYLDRLDHYIVGTLIPQYTRGARRKHSKPYRRLSHRAAQLGKAGRRQEAARVRQQLVRLPCTDTHDPDYRRLRYLRYADDFLLGFAGPRAEAEAITADLRAFLRDALNLALSEEKTLITQGRTAPARFLGYDVSIFQRDTARPHGKRYLNGNVRLGLPDRVLKEQCARYTRHGKPVSRPELLNDTDFSIIAQFQSEYRGLVEYYRLAHDLRRLNKLK